MDANPNPDRLRPWLSYALKIAGWALPLGWAIVMALLSARDSLKANTTALNGVQAELAAVRAEVASKVTLAQVDARIQAEFARLRITESLAELRVEMKHASDGIKEIKDGLRK